MLASVTHIVALTCIRRARLLPVNGRVLVRAGQKVSATDVIAETRLASEHLLLDTARGLGLPPAKADKLVTRNIGEEVGEGDIIAGPIGLFQRSVRVPKAGRVAAIGGGQVLIELKTPNEQLKAGLAGIVTELVPDRGAVIEANGVLVQGVWGNQGIEQGVLTLLARSADDPLTPDRLDVSMRGAMVLGGPCAHPEIFELAAEIPIRAIIVSSITEALIPYALQSSIPVLVLEGIGNIPLNPLAYKLLSTNDKRDICVNAAQWDRMTGTRPELVIPLPTSGQVQPPRETDIFAPGQMVRVTQAPYRGVIAAIAALRPGLTAFPSGIRAAAAVVRFENGEQANVPLANLEVIE